MAEKLRAVEEAAAQVREAEGGLQLARARLRDTLREAHREGASYAFLGRLVGLTRERVSQIARQD